MDSEFFSSDALYQWEFKNKGYAHFDNQFVKDRVDRLLLHLKQVGQISHPFYPLIKIELPKFKRDENGRIFNDKENPRPIMHTARIDANIYSFYRNILMNEYEGLLKQEGINECVIAYRKIPIGNGFKGNKCNLHFANEAIEEIKKRVKDNECVAMALDISKFFASLDHSLIKRQWCRVMRFPQEKMPNDHFCIYKNITRFRYINAPEVEKILNVKFNTLRKEGKLQICDPKTFRNKITPHLSHSNTIGIPQGTTISDVIANMYMLDFDIAMKNHADQYGGYYRRYSDDILIVCSTDMQDKFLDFISSSLMLTGEKPLQISHKKTLVSRFNAIEGGIRCISYKRSEETLKEIGKPFEYLGLSFDGNHKCIRQSTLSKFHQKLSARIKVEVRIAASKLERKGKICTVESLYQNISFDMIHNSYMENREKRLQGDDFLGNFYTYVVKAADITENQNILSLYDGMTAWIRKRASFYCVKYVAKHKHNSSSIHSPK